MSEPFQILYWDIPREPTPDFLMRMLVREGLTPEQEEFPPGTRTLEMKYDCPIVLVLLSGRMQVAFPGYGVRDLDPGDTLEVEAGVLHDFTVTSSGQPAVILRALRA